MSDSQLQIVGTAGNGQHWPNSLAERFSKSLAAHWAELAKPRSIETLSRTIALPMRSLKASLEFITDKLDNDLHLAEIASVAQLSPFHFARLFKTATGQSPYQYLLDQRLRRAKDFLKSSSLPIAEIAAQVGFPDHAHFSRAFRKREGVSPTAWRKTQQL